MDIKDMKTLRSELDVKKIQEKKREILSKEKPYYAALQMIRKITSHLLNRKWVCLLQK